MSNAPQERKVFKFQLHLQNCFLNIVVIRTVKAPPSWVIDDSTEEVYKKALASKVSPRTLLSRTDTELFLLRIKSNPGNRATFVIFSTFGTFYILRSCTYTILQMRLEHHGGLVDCAKPTQKYTAERHWKL